MKVCWEQKGKIKNEAITHAYVHWLADVHSGGFAPAFTLSFHDSECSRKPPMPIASVVRCNFKKWSCRKRQKRLRLNRNLKLLASKLIGIKKAGEKYFYLKADFAFEQWFSVVDENQFRFKRLPFDICLRNSSFFAIFDKKSIFFVFYQQTTTVFIKHKLKYCFWIVGNIQKTAPNTPVCVIAWFISYVGVEPAITYIKIGKGASPPIGNYTYRRYVMRHSKKGKKTDLRVEKSLTNCPLLRHNKTNL